MTCVQVCETYYSGKESFDVLITDLHMPNPGDGFTVVSAMRHSQPDALTLLVSGYPDVKSAMAAILLEADEIIVKPFEVGKLADSCAIRCSLANRRCGLRRRAWLRSFSVA
jgi:DNA-binding NtrC family response regulator